MIGATGPFDWVILSDVDWLVDLCRWAILIVWVMTAALLLALYRQHRTGNMNWLAGYGSVGAFLTIAWAQPRAIISPADDLIPLNLMALVTGIMCLAGTLQAMRVTLFRRKQ